MEAKGQSFESWCIVELMGHQRMAGFVTEATIGGGAMIRIDVPECGELPAYTRYLAPGALYAINPCDEKTARAAAASFRPQPVNKWEIDRQVPQLTAGTDDEERDDELL